MTISQRFRIAESLGLSEKREKSVVVGWGLVSQDHIHFIGTKALQRKTVAFEATIWEWFTPSMQFVSKITCAILGMVITTYYYILLPVVGVGDGVGVTGFQAFSLLWSPSMNAESKD